MYVDVKISKRGEIVIPAFIRKMFKFKEGGSVRFKVQEEQVALVSPKQDFIQWLRETSKKEAIPEKNIICGDELYEEVF